MLAHTQMPCWSLLVEARIAEALIISLAPFRKQAQSVFLTNPQLKVPDRLVEVPLAILVDGLAPLRGTTDLVLEAICVQYE